MKKLKILLVVFLFAAMLVGAAEAKNFPGDRAGWKSDYLYKRLDLTLDQYSLVYQAFLKYEFKVDDLKTKFAADKVGLQSAMDKEKEALFAELGKVFKADQKTKFDPLKDKVMKYRPKKRVVKKVEGTETEKKEEKKDVKKDEKKDVKKDEKKDVKKDEKKDVKKEEKKN